MNCSQLFVNIIKLALWDIPINEKLYLSFSDEDWARLYKESQLQGLSAIFVDGLNKLDDKTQSCSLFLKKTGIKTVIASETRWQRQLTIVKSLTNVCQENNIRLLLLKGLGLSLCYPNPKHRQSGDIDIYLFGHYEEGNSLAKEILGAKIKKFNKKEDHIILGTFSIDNHITFLWTDTEEKRNFDLYLKKLLVTRQLERIPETDIYLPPSDFNYLFLVSHSYSHFMREGMPLRQVTDLACFLAKHKTDIDWDEINDVLQRFHLKKFSDAMLAFIQYYFQIAIDNNLVSDQRLLERMFNDVLGHKHTVVYHKSWISAKTYLIKTAWMNRWRYNAFYDGGFLRYMIDNVLKKIH